MTQIYLDKPEQWSALAERCRRAGVIGLDTEFYGVDVMRQSCVGRARVHVFSVAVRSDRLAPRGHHRARGWVLPVAALSHPDMRALLEDPVVIKWLHNRPVDHHALANEGVTLRGSRDSLGYARWKFPQLINQGRFGLKNLMVVLLGRAPVCEFSDVVQDVRTITVMRRRTSTVSSCSCGTPGCKKKIGHTRTWERVVTEVPGEKREKFRHPLESIIPGHPRWDLLLRYAAEDSVAALEIAELCDLEPDPAGYPGTRPGYNHDVDLAITEMEEVGIPVDVHWCSMTLERVIADENVSYLGLREWYRSTFPTSLTEDADVDKLWRSHPRMVGLFAELGYPRSPVWKLGPVPRGETKLDQTAMEWIAGNHPPAFDLVERLIRIKRIWVAKKYLTKLVASGGTVHPICGAAGDADDRAGAVTGRIGIKGELEAQQLPTAEERDPYRIRRAVACTEATPGPTSWRCHLQVHDEIQLRRAGFPLVVADYSALEVVILADLVLRLFGDDQLARAVAPGAPDIHSVNALLVFGRHLGWNCPDGTPVSDIPVDQFRSHPHGKRLRTTIKTFFYGLAYRKGAYGFSTTPGADGRAIGEEGADRILSAFRLAMPGMFRWHDHVTEYIRKFGGMYSLGGRWCDLREETSRDAPSWMFRRAERRATNFPMQATAAEIVGDAMVRVARCPVLADPATTPELASETLVLHMTSSTANGVPLLVPLQVKDHTGWSYADAK